MIFYTSRCKIRWTCLRQTKRGEIRWSIPPLLYFGSSFGFIQKLLVHFESTYPFKIIKTKSQGCFSKSLVLNLIAVFRIKTYEDVDTNVPLMGMSIDVFHFMGKNKSGFVGNRHPYFPQTLSGFATFTCINESLSLRSLIRQTVGTHFIWEEAEIVF